MFVPPAHGQYVFFCSSTEPGQAKTITARSINMICIAQFSELVVQGSPHCEAYTLRRPPVEATSESEPLVWKRGSKPLIWKQTAEASQCRRSTGDIFPDIPPSSGNCTGSGRFCGGAEEGGRPRGESPRAKAAIVHCGGFGQVGLVFVPSDHSLLLTA